jgi:hypothetical protein
MKGLPALPALLAVLATAGLPAPTLTFANPHLSTAVDPARGGRISSLVATGDSDWVTSVAHRGWRLALDHFVGRNWLGAKVVERQGWAWVGP